MESMGNQIMLVRAPYDEMGSYVGKRIQRMVVGQRRRGRPIRRWSGIVSGMIWR